MFTSLGEGASVNETANSNILGTYNEFKIPHDPMLAKLHGVEIVHKESNSGWKCKTVRRA